MAKIWLQIIGTVTHTMVKRTSHVNEAVVSFSIGLVYRGNMGLNVIFYLFNYCIYYILTVGVPY